MEDEPHYILCNYESIPHHVDVLRSTHNPLLGIVRYAVFEPFYTDVKNDLTTYSFSEHIQHTPLCYFKA